MMAAAADGRDGEESSDCPLCCTELDLTDRSIQYCGCGYQMCLWCYHHILEEAGKESLAARCPNCRSEYDQNQISMQHIDAEKLEEEKRKLRDKDRPGKPGPAVVSIRSRASLTNVRVVQPNLVYAVGLTMEVCREEVLREAEYFGQFGKVIKISVNRSNQFASALAKHGPTGSAYVTFRRGEDALRCIKAIDGVVWGGKPIKACFGTTKYCSAFLRGLACNNPDCLYLHQEADEADCLTKEEVAAGLLPARFLAMGAHNTFKPRLTINSIPNPATAAAQAAAAAAVAAGQPPAAVAAAAAAAGGVNRAASQQQQPPQPPRTVVITVPIPNSQGHHHHSHHHAAQQQQQQHEGGSPLLPAPQAAALAAQQAPGASPSWAAISGTAAASGLTGASSAPPPPGDKQEWPQLSGGGPGPAEVPGTPAGGGSGLARAPSMAEQLARAHSHPHEARAAAKPVKKMLPLSSPAKLKPLGRTVITVPISARTPPSPTLANGGGPSVAAAGAAPSSAAGGATNSSSSAAPAALASACAEQRGGLAAGMGGLGQAFQGLGLQASSGLGSRQGSALGPPPGFGMPAGSELPSSRPRKVAPPPGFAPVCTPDLAGPSRSSIELAAGGYHGGGLGSRSALFGSGLGDQPLPHSNLYCDSDSLGLGGMPAPRRQTSRFAFAQAEVDSGYGGGGDGYGDGGYGGGNLGGGSHFGGGAPPPAASGSQQPQDAGAFFRSLFPGASVSVATPGQHGPSPAPPPGAPTSALVGSYGGSGGGSVLLGETRFRGGPLAGGLGHSSAPPAGTPYLQQQQQQQQQPPPGYQGGGGSLGGNASGINLLRQLQGSGASAATDHVHPPGFTRL